MSTLRTPLCDRLGIEVPVVQAPIGSVCCPDLAAAVSDAGGLGTLAVTWLGLDATESVIAATRDRTDRPLGINLVPDPETTVHPTAEHLEVCLDAGVGLVSFSFGDAAPYVDRVHDAGGTVLQTVGSAEEARTAVDAGVDVLVSQGWEAGGHVQSDVATMPLVPAVADVAGQPPAGERPGEDEQVAQYGNGHPIERYDDDPPLSGMDGDVEALAMYAGQSADVTEAVQPAAEIVDELVATARERIDGLSELATGT